MAASHDLQRLYDDHAQSLFAFLLNFTRQEADARDVLQELFLKLGRHPHLLHKVTEPRAFLIRLAHNQAIDLMRRRATRQKNYDQLAAESDSVFAPSDTPDDASFRLELTAALAELPAEQRTVVHLKLWEDMTFEAIAETLCIPPNTAASRYRYGIDKLRARLRPLYDEIRQHGRV
jgi:RNA polymerase sigma-70 factor (ECF subfamily)